MHKLPASAFSQAQTILTQQQNRSLLFNMAIGYNIAHHTQLPPTKIDDPEEFFSGANTEVRYAFLGVLGDSMPINYDDIRSYAKSFWLAKYSLVYGKAVPPVGNPNTLYNLTYLGVYIPAAQLDIIEKQGQKFLDYVSFGDCIYDSIRDQVARKAGEVAHV